VPTLLVDEQGFRIVHDVVSEQDVFTLEKRVGHNAMGEPHWEKVETRSTKMVEMLYRYILKIKAGELNAQG
jgi:hypothetical protein